MSNDLIWPPGIPSQGTRKIHRAKQIKKKRSPGRSPLEGRRSASIDRNHQRAKNWKVTDQTKSWDQHWSSVVSHQCSKTSSGKPTSESNWFFNVVGRDSLLHWWLTKQRYDGARKPPRSSECAVGNRSSS